MPLYSVRVSRIVQQSVSALIEVEAPDKGSAEALALARYEEEGFDLYPEGYCEDGEEPPPQAAAMRVKEA